MKIAYNYRWNTVRRTKSLQWQTPDETIAKAYVRVVAWLVTLKEEPQGVKYVDMGITTEGNCILKIKPPKAKAKKKLKKMSAVDRYLQWMDGDRKKYYEAFFPMSGISLNFSIKGQSLELSFFKFEKAEEVT